MDVAGKVDDGEVDDELGDLEDGDGLLPGDADLEAREGVVEVCVCTGVSAYIRASSVARTHTSRREPPS